MTRTELFKLYEGFVETDAIPVEAVNAAIDEYARANQMRFTDVLDSLHAEFLFGPNPDDIDFDVHPPHPDDFPF